MARPGVTYTEVAESAMHLISQGKNPTIEQIRLLLGTGSSTTIANHLKKWKEAQQSNVLMAVKENLPQELVDIVKSLWGKVLDESETKVQTIEARAKQEIAVLNEELQKYKTNNQRWQKLFHEWTEEKQKLDAENKLVNENLSLLQKENEADQNKNKLLTQELKEKQHRIAELHRLHAQVQANLEYFRESSREQRMLDQQQFDQQKQALQIEIKVLNEQLIKQRDYKEELKQQLHTEKFNYVALEQTHQKIQSEFKSMAEKFNESERKKNEYLQFSLNIQNQHNELQKALLERNNEIHLLFTERNEINNELIALKHSLHELKKSKVKERHESP